MASPSRQGSPWHGELPPLTTCLPASPSFPPPNWSTEVPVLDQIRQQGEKRLSALQADGSSRRASVQTDLEQFGPGSLRHRFQQMKQQVQKTTRPTLEQQSGASEHEISSGFEEPTQFLHRARVLEPLQRPSAEILRAELIVKDARIKELEVQVEVLLAVVAERDRELAELRKDSSKQPVTSMDSWLEESGESPQPVLSGRSASSSGVQSGVSKPSADASNAIDTVVQDVSNDLGLDMPVSSNGPSLVEDVDDLSCRSSIADLPVEDIRRNSRRSSTFVLDGLPPLADRSKRRSNTLELPMCTSLWAAQTSPANSASDDEPPDGTLKGLDSVLKGSPKNSPRTTPKGGRTPVRFARKIDCMSPRSSMIEEKLQEKLEHATIQNRKLADKLEMLEEHFEESVNDTPKSTEVYSNETVRGAATLLEQMSSLPQTQQDQFGKAPSSLQCIRKEKSKEMPELTITVSVTRGRRETDSSHLSMRSELLSEQSPDPSIGSKRRSSSSSSSIPATRVSPTSRRSAEQASSSVGRKGIIKKASCSSLYSSPRSSRSSRAGSSKAGSSNTPQGTPHTSPRATLMSGPASPRGALMNGLRNQK